MILGGNRFTPSESLPFFGSHRTCWWYEAATRYLCIESSPFWSHRGTCRWYEDANLQQSCRYVQVELSQNDMPMKWGSRTILLIGKVTVDEERANDMRKQNGLNDLFCYHGSVKERLADDMRLQLHNKLCSIPILPRLCQTPQNTMLQLHNKLCSIPFLVTEGLADDMRLQHIFSPQSF